MPFIVEITDKPITKDQFSQSVSCDAYGAELIFFGVVRRQNHGRKVKAVSYDVFVPLAERSFREICLEAMQRSNRDVSIMISHRIGTLIVGEVSLAVGVGSPHRNEAYEVSRFVLEEIKKRSPIWKKEHYEDGETEWLQGHALCDGEHSEHVKNDPKKECKITEVRGRVTGVVLAGGLSSRMGQNKSYLQSKGQSFVEKMATLLKASGVDQVIISGDVKGYYSVPDEVTGCGPLGGLSSVLNSELTVKTDILFVLPVDMPLLRPEVLKNLLDEFQSKRFYAAKALHFDRYELPAVFRASADLRLALDEILKLKPQARSIHSLLQALQAPALPCSPQWQQDFMNINTPRDLEHLKKVEIL